MLTFHLTFLGLVSLAVLRHAACAASNGVSVYGEGELVRKATGYEQEKS